MKKYVDKQFLSVLVDLVRRERALRTLEMFNSTISSFIPLVFSTVESIETFRFEDESDHEYEI